MGCRTHVVKDPGYKPCYSSHLESYCLLHQTYELAKIHFSQNATIITSLVQQCPTAEDVCADFFPASRQHWALCVPEKY